MVGIAGEGARGTAGICGKAGPVPMDVIVVGSTFMVAVGTFPTETGCRLIIDPFTDGTEVGGGPVPEVTEAMSIFTGL